MNGVGQDFLLPSLAPHLKLSRAPDTAGEPTWTLHNPVANTYFKIDWVAFECLARFPLHKNAVSLKDAIEKETTLSVTTEQIADVVMFLQQNNLVLLRDQVTKERKKASAPLWKKALHTYLYVPIPLFQPQETLERIYPKIQLLFSRAFLVSMTAFFVMMILWTLPRVDEFFNTFHAFLSLEGAAATLLVLGFVKIVHEFAHAFTAIRYGVKVPHMGVAFIVMYPVLYTETTGSWQLSSRRARFHIAVAGVVAELCLAAVFLALWHVFPAGSIGQSACFLVVCVSLVGSLAVNLNPLMRFDGYYMISDATGIDNLQSRSCNFARYRLREVLFGLKENPPEDLSDKEEKFLTVFGASLLIYRFFLFTGIAFLVYHVFLQPLGFFLMMVELSWFIFLPVWSEIKVWWAKRKQIAAQKRSLIPAAAMIVALLGLIVPWKSTTLLPAVIHTAEHQLFYAPAASEIMAVHVQDGQEVYEGELLAELRSFDLDFKLKKARQELSTVETMRRRGQANADMVLDAALSDAAIEKARVNVALLEEQKKRLAITAPFSGIIRDFNPELQAGRYIRIDEPLFVMINPKSGMVVTAFASEENREKVREEEHAEFFSEDRTLTISDLSLQHMSSTGEKGIDWAELSSLYGGPIAADRDPAGAILLRRPHYLVQTGATAEILPMVSTGYLKVSSAPQSIFSIFINWLGGLVRQEAKLG